MTIAILPTRCEQAQKAIYLRKGTVKTHVNHLLNRLNLKNRAQLAIYVNSVFSKRDRLDYPSI
jgi:hypothetical protein